MSRPVAPLKVLIVEDEALIVMDLEAAVADAGHEVVAEVGSLRDLSDLKVSVVPDLALVDVHLADGNSGLDASDRIRDRWGEVSIVFVTANPGQVPDGHCGAFGIIPKPFTQSGLRATLEYLSNGICRPPPKKSAPRGFVEFGEFRESWIRDA